MKQRSYAAILLLLVLYASTADSQTKPPRPSPAASSSGVRYFQLTLNLTFGANGEQQETAQTITTEFVVRGTIPGSCKARMVAQYPTGSGTGTRYMELGTKFDADDMHLDGDGVALHFVLSASRPVKMIKYKSKDGVEMEEPIITERNVELSVKVPLDQPKVVFDSASRTLAPLKSLPGNPKADPAAEAASGVPLADQPMVVSLTLSEVK